MKKDWRVEFSGESREPGTAEAGPVVAGVVVVVVVVVEEVSDGVAAPLDVEVAGRVVVVVVDVGSDSGFVERLNPARVSMAVWMSQTGISSSSPTERMASA